VTEKLRSKVNESTYIIVVSYLARLCSFGKVKKAKLQL
jgi:hypothetical protein